MSAWTGITSPRRISIWTEAEGKHLRIDSVGEEVDDMLGPLVNKPVTVYVSVAAEKRIFLDIELDSQTPGTTSAGSRPTVAGGHQQLLDRDPQ